jgi:hypothetical protein
MTRTTMTGVVAKLREIGRSREGLDNLPSELRDSEGRKTRLLAGAGP